MTTTCLISNYNYAAYVGEAVDSALGQSVPFDQIVVVDDGSTDDSFALLTAKYGDYPQVEIVHQENQGQLSCFNAGFSRATGDIIFFLDADDVFEPNYVEQALGVYDRHHGCDFLSCGKRVFGERDGMSLKFATDRDLGYSVILTAFLREWIGAATSCLSMRRSVLSKVLPLPFAEEWMVRADDCLVFGASLAGARKCYLAQPLVRYRVHARNNFCGHVSERATSYRRRLAVNRLFEYLERKLCYNVPRLGEFLHREFCTIDAPTLRQLYQYIYISQTAPISLVRQAACIGAMIHHFVRASLRGASSGPPAVRESVSRIEIPEFGDRLGGQESRTQQQAA